jgi:hypothetical protein
VSQLLPQIKWIDRGRICEGAEWKTSPTIAAALEILPIQELLKKLHIKNLLALETT